MWALVVHEATKKRELKLVELIFEPVRTGQVTGWVYRRNKTKLRASHHVPLLKLLCKTGGLPAEQRILLENVKPI